MRFEEDAAFRESLEDRTRDWLLDEVLSLTRENTLLRKLWDKNSEEINTLRAEIEELRLTPEVKADTEAAFKRGYERARRNLRVGLVHLVDSLKDDEDTDKENE